MHWLVDNANFLCVLAGMTALGCGMALVAAAANPVYSLARARAVLAIFLLWGWRAWW